MTHNFLILTLIFFASLAVNAAQIHLSTGENALLPASGKVSIPKTKVFAVKDLGLKIQVSGKRVGSSWIEISGKRTEIFVLDSVQTRTLSTLRAALPKTLGLNLAVTDGKVRVQGKLARFQDWKILAEVCERKNCDYSADFLVSKSLMSHLEQQLRQHLADRGAKLYPVQWQRPLKAIVPKLLASTDLQVYKSLGLAPEFTSSNLVIEPLVRVQITVAEVRREEILKMGIQWPASIQAQVWPNYSTDSQSALAQLDLLEKSGLSKTLASPSLLSRSGKTAEFVAGGEFPIKISNLRMQSVTWKKYGIVLKIKPEADHGGRMSIYLETEVSALDPSSAVDGIPGLFTNRIQSHFDLEKSKTIVLSGLIKSDQSKVSQGLPGLSKLPILGHLFASEDFRDNKTELLVFVTPEVVNPSQL